MTFIIDDNVATPCECRAIREAEDLLKKSGVSEEFRQKRFMNFNYARDIQTMGAYKLSTGYVKDFKSIEKDRCNSIMFMGQVGSGKTHLSLAIGSRLIEMSKSYLVKISGKKLNYRIYG